MLINRQHLVNCRVTPGTRAHRGVKQSGEYGAFIFLQHCEKSCKGARERSRFKGVTSCLLLSPDLCLSWPQPWPRGGHTARAETQPLHRDQWRAVIVLTLKMLLSKHVVMCSWWQVLNRAARPQRQTSGRAACADVSSVVNVFTARVKILHTGFLFTDLLNHAALRNVISAWSKASCFIIGCSLLFAALWSRTKCYKTIKCFSIQLKKNLNYIPVSLTFITPDHSWAFLMLFKHIHIFLHIHNSPFFFFFFWLTNIKKDFLVFCLQWKSVPLHHIFYFHIFTLFARSTDPIFSSSTVWSCFFYLFASLLRRWHINTGTRSVASWPWL